VQRLEPGARNPLARSSIAAYLEGTCRLQPVQSDHQGSTIAIDPRPR